MVDQVTGEQVSGPERLVNAYSFLGMLVANGARMDKAALLAGIANVRCTLREYLIIERGPNVTKTDEQASQGT